MHLLRVRVRVHVGRLEREEGRGGRRGTITRADLSAFLPLLFLSRWTTLFEELEALDRPEDSLPLRLLRLSSWKDRT